MAVVGGGPRRPALRLHGSAAAAAAELGVALAVSLTHADAVAGAVVAAQAERQ